MVIFHSYVKLPEGISAIWGKCKERSSKWNTQAGQNKVWSFLKCDENHYFRNLSVVMAM